MKSTDIGTREANMSTAQSGAVCEKCGRGVGKNEEGRTTCTGCNMATDNCTCSRQS